MIDSTVGGASAVSYVSLSDATTYFATRVNATAWTSATDPQREAALVSATNRLEQEGWQGTKVSTTQRLKWPREGTFDEEGTEYSTTAIPRPIQEATYELAIGYLENPSGISGNALEPFAALSVGPIDLDLRSGPTSSQKLPAAVVRLIRGLWLSLGTNTATLLRA